MRFMILMSEGADAWAKLSKAEQDAVMEAHAAFQSALEAAGKYVLSQRLAPGGRAKTVRRDADGRVSVTDGPFAEAKEVVGGFYVIEADSLDEAVAWARRARFIAGANEVREIVGD